MFSFAMTSGLASDSDNLKISIALRRARKCEGMGPFKNFQFLFNPLVPKFFLSIRLLSHETALFDVQ